jgi:hypothetical protein
MFFFFFLEGKFNLLVFTAGTTLVHSYALQQEKNCNLKSFQNI